jgi:hypothetical protein
MFWISPDVNIFDDQHPKHHSKMRQHRSSITEKSPYRDQSGLLKLTLALKTFTRKQSPNSSAKFKTSPYKSAYLKPAKPPVQASYQRKRVIRQTKKEKKKVTNGKLKVLDKKACKKAPKIFNNQIFRDIYDEKGNHDRVMETFELSETKIQANDSALDVCKLIIASGLEAEKEVTEHRYYIKPPENSILAETDRKLTSDYLELYKKLETLAQAPANPSDI